MEDNHARLNVTYAGHNGDLADPVPFDAPDSDIKAWTTEAIQNGSIAGIPAIETVDLADFVVDRFSSNDSRPFPLIQIRPKTPFGIS